MTATSIRRRQLLFLVKAVISLGLLALLYRRVDLYALGAQLGRVRAGWLVACFGLLYLNTLISTLKWRLLLAADGIHVPLGTLLSSYLIGSFFNVFLPSTIGGDVYRLVDIGRRSARTANTGASIFADRLSGFLALACYGLVAAVCARQYIPDARLMLLPLMACGGLAAAAFVVWQQTLVRRLAGWLPVRIQGRVDRLLDPFLASIRVYGRQPGVLARMLAISFWFQFNAILAVYCLSRALAQGVPLLPFAFFVPFITLLETIPVSLFGVGLRDTGYAWFMASVGRGRAEAAALALLYVAVTLIYIAQGGVLFALRRRRG